MEPTKRVVQIPYVCPICAGVNAIELVRLSRAGGMSCARCGKWLKVADVMRAMHHPRAPAASDAPVPVRRPALPRPAPAPIMRRE